MASFIRKIKAERFIPPEYRTVKITTCFEEEEPLPPPPDVDPPPGVETRQCPIKRYILVQVGAGIVLTFKWTTISVPVDEPCPNPEEFGPPYGTPPAPGPPPPCPSGRCRPDK